MFVSLFPDLLVKMATHLGMKTAYLENLISDHDFENINGIYDTNNALAVLKVLCLPPY